MRKLLITLPKTVDFDDNEVKMALATKLYELGKLSLGQAAEMVGCSKEAFMELLGDYGVSYFSQSPDELNEDASNAEDYSR